MTDSVSAIRIVIKWQDFYGYKSLAFFMEWKGEKHGYTLFGLCSDRICFADQRS